MSAETPSFGPGPGNPESMFNRMRAYRIAEAQRRLTRQAGPLGRVGLESVMGTFLAAQYRANREPLLREVFDYNALPRDDTLAILRPIGEVDSILACTQELLVKPSNSPETDVHGRLQARRLLVSMAQERNALFADVPKEHRQDGALRCELAGLVDRAIVSRLQASRAMDGSQMAMFEVRNMQAAIEPLTDALRLAALTPENL